MDELGATPLPLTHPYVAAHTQAEPSPAGLLTVRSPRKSYISQSVSAQLSSKDVRRISQKRVNCRVFPPTTNDH